MDVIITNTAAKQLKAMPAADAKQIVEAARQVAALHPQRPSYVTELVGTQGGWRLRKGDWRAFYLIHEGSLIVTRVIKRGEAYR